MHSNDGNLQIGNGSGEAGLENKTEASLPPFFVPQPA
jgi:hypothetical protein